MHPPAQTLGVVAVIAGLRLREPELQPLAEWIAERLCRLGLAHNENFAQLSARETEVGHRELACGNGLRANSVTNGTGVGRP